MTRIYRDRVGVAAVALLAVLLVVQTAWTAPTFDPPRQVVLTPASARVQVEATVSVLRQEGQSVLVLTLPQDAADPVVNLAPPHQDALLAWRIETQPVVSTAADISTGGRLARQRAALTLRVDSLKGDIDALKARMALWSTPPLNVLSLEQMELREARMARSLPAAAVELEQKQRALEALQQQLAQLPETVKNVKLLTITLHNQLKEGTSLKVLCAYSLPNCNWQPVYAINASDDAVDVRLEAEIQQYSGMDWTGATIALITQDAGALRPRPVTPWVVRKESLLREMKAAAPASLAAPLRMLPEEDSLKSKAIAIESDTLAGWTLPQGTAVPEGVSRLPLLHETWADAVQRLARPDRYDRKVWLTTVHEFTGQPLPPGRAAFSLDGSPLGEGLFQPKGNKVTLFFGVDPLVEVATEPDTRLTGKSGIINKRQTWKWGWTYTVINKRSAAVTVRLEEPDPQASDEAITVVCEDTPPSQKGEDKTLYWDVSVPARGEAEVRHLVTVTAPDGMNIIPGR